MMNVLKRILFCIALAGISWPALASAVALDPAAVDFFESKIRPILVEHCYECHSTSKGKAKGGLLLDSKEGVIAGGDSGPAIVPGDPEQSLLIKAVRYLNEDLQMPPKNKRLADEQISLLEEWIRIGAPDPRDGSALAGQSSESEKHWAFAPVVKPAVPTVADNDWIRSPVDAFVLEKLEKNGLRPSAPADKRTLIRRVAYDLTGLPPSHAEVAAFLADNSPEAYARIVEQYLGSPHYGERWARHWLDVARYADTKGYVFEEERRFPYAYTYRDYVIQAFNDDLPFDQFIIEQIAADHLELGEDKRPLAALGFLTLGRRFLNNQPDIIDDRIDVVTRGTMGLTVSCARCHDHKYDPIPIEDYYSLYGVFASSEEPGEKPLLGTAALPPQYNDYLAERAKREKELADFRENKVSEIFAQLRQNAGDYLLAAHDAQQLGDSSEREALARKRKLDPTVVQRWTEQLKQWKDQPHPVFAPWFAFAAIEPSSFAERASEVTAKLTAQTSSADPALNPRVRAAFTNAPASMEEVAKRYGALFAAADKEWNELKATGASSLPPDQEELRQVLYAQGGPLDLSFDQVRRIFDVPSAQRLRALRRQVDELDATHPGSPPRAMALVDRPNPHQPRVFLRGNPQNHGPEVPRQFLALLSGPDRKPFTQGSGRLELARAIASPDNPLTARVFVNRVWLHHFNSGLVNTPSDFGVRADPPSHPELLDYLAADFVENGWSIKRLHRLIMLSSTYQQASDDKPEGTQVDPSNRLLWRMNRKRLDLESMRDTLLHAADNLQRSIGGRPVDIVSTEYSPRRTIYGFIDRQNLPGLFRTFDFASPDTTSPRRFFTTVPQQALFMINSPFVAEQAKRLAQRIDSASAGSVEERVRRLYELLYQRAPTSSELQLGAQFVASQKANPDEESTSAWAKYAQVLLMANELVFVD